MAAKKPAVNAAFADLCKKKYIDQAIWFLNGFWTRGAQEEAEKIWTYSRKFIEIDKKGESGNELEEVDAHKFLESLGETMTVIEMRNQLRQIDTDANGRMALLEYLVFRYRFGLDETVSSPQGTVNQAEVDAAQAAFDEVSQALTANIAAVEALERAVAELDAAVAELDAAVKKTKAAVAELSTAEAELRAAEAELQSAVNDLKTQEDAYHGAIASAEAKANDESLGVVKRNKAANELAQLRGEDPLPLRRAKLTQEAALRRVQKEAAKVAAAREAMQAVQREQEQKQREMEAKKRDQEAAKAEAERQQVELEAKLAEASAKLEELRNTAGTPEGLLWYMQRMEIEADKYLPPSKQRFAHLHVNKRQSIAVRH